MAYNRSEVIRLYQNHYSDWDIAEKLAMRIADVRAILWQYNYNRMHINLHYDLTVHGPSDYD
jgi:hypothetical protein